MGKRLGTATDLVGNHDLSETQDAASPCLSGQEQGWYVIQSMVLAMLALRMTTSPTRAEPLGGGDRMGV